MREAINKIKTEPLPQVSIVHGPEIIWQEQIYIALEKRNLEDPMGQWNWSVFYGDKEFELEPLFAELSMLPWGDSLKIVILKEAELIPAARMETLAGWLKENNRTNPLFIFLTKVDNRLKYVKNLREIAWDIECKPLEGDALLRYVVDYCLERGKKMERTVGELFLERVGTNLSFIHQELEKLISWCGDQGEITEESVEAVSSLFPGQVAKQTVFQMTDLIVQKKRQEALAVLNLLLTAGEAPLRILPLIERQLRLILAIKTGEGRLDDIARQMGENSSYGLKKLQRYKGNFTLDEIFAGFEAVVKADQELKLGSPGEQVLVDLIVKLTA